MAERIVSPGVFTNEIDQSFLAGGIAQIGAAIVGPTVKGPALVPTQITSYSDFIKIFGDHTPNSYVPFVVEDYLRAGGNVITVTRLLYEDGYKLTNGALAITAESASTKIVTHVLHPTRPVTSDGATSLFGPSLLSTDTLGNFALTVSGAYVAGADANAIGFNGSFAQTANISASISSLDNDYISIVFGKSALSNNYPVYVQYDNPTAFNAFTNTALVTMSLNVISNYEFLQDYQTASTPYITSQNIGSSPTNLFRFHTLSHGTSVNHEVKVGIADIRTSTETADPDGYGSFTVIVRRVNTLNFVGSPYVSSDTDSSTDTVETYTNCNLNPESPNYIVRKIGNKYQTINDSNELIVSGEYANISKFIRVEVDAGVSNKTNAVSLIPFGFRAMTSPIPMVSGSVNLSPITYQTTQTSGTYNSSTYFGFNFDVINNLNYIAPIPTSGSTTGSNSDFYLGNILQDAGAAFPAATPYSGSLEGALTGATFSSNISNATRKFIVPFQGGFDGAKPNLKKYSGANITAANTFGFNCSTPTSTGTAAYNKAFSLLSNTDYYDMNLLVTPGIIDSLHPSITSAARSLATTRQDTFYVMDSNPISDSITAVVNQVTALDSNYSAVYWPWLEIPSRNPNKPIFVPPSVMIPGVLAFNDSVQAPWYAPAGLNRGSMETVSDTYKHLSQSDRDALYTARVNPIANFVNDGVVVFGQKTMQARPSALDRINVRRLLIEVKKFIASSTKYLVFEQNTSATRNKFLNIVNPYMEQIKARQGLYAFRVIMDGTNNTADLIDQNIMYGQIFMQPTRTAEFIILDFNIQPTGAAFPE
jgi:hypothetical protein